MAPSHPSPPRENIPFLSLAPGTGGTFSLEPIDAYKTKEGYNLIGTTQCLSCVGVYLPLYPNRCFVAHINAYVDDTRLDDRIQSNITAAEGEQIRKQVLEKLHQHSISQGWSKEEVLNAFAANMANPVIVCRYFKDKPGRPGPYVVQAIDDFLEERTIEKMADYVEEGRDGFIKSLASSVVQWVSVGRTVESLGFRHVPVEDETCGWDVRIERKGPEVTSKRMSVRDSLRMWKS